MAEPLLGTGGSSSCDASAEVVAFDSSVNGGPCDGFRIKNTHGSLGLKVRVAGMHIDRTLQGGTDGMALLDPGESALFVNEGNNISKIYVKAASAGTVTFKGFVQKRA